jgi:hypothetical protein
MNLQRFSRKASKGIGIAGIDKNILDYYSNINSRYSLSSFGL